MWMDLEEKLAYWDSEFARQINEDGSEHIQQEDLEWIETSLPLLERDEQAISLRL
jgi:hypothetical protein